MKKPFALICGTIALLCLVSMFMPIVAPRYPAAQYHPASDTSPEYVLSGDYYYAREYWSITRFMLASHSPLLQIVLSVTQALLLYWAVLSFLGETAPYTGLIASIVNLAVTAFFLIQMLSVAGSSRWGVIVMLAVDTLAAVALAVVHKRTG